jgi:hypothetical protein
VLARESGYSAAQLKSLLVTLIMDGDEHRREILESNAEILMADLVEEGESPVK